MACKTEIRLGLTPAFKRIAHYYLCLGFGDYKPLNHPHYDHVSVRSLYDFRENPEVEGEYAGGTIVEFFLDQKRVKWVEFRCQAIGGGGETAIRLL